MVIVQVAPGTSVPNVQVTPGHMTDVQVEMSSEMVELEELVVGHYALQRMARQSGCYFPAKGRRECTVRDVSPSCFCSLSTVLRRRLFSSSK